MSNRTWARSAGKPSTRSGVSRGPRPAGSWGAALDRARREWDALAGGPPVDLLTGAGARRYSEQAAAAILALAVALWPDVAAGMAELDQDG